MGLLSLRVATQTRTGQAFPPGGFDRRNRIMNHDRIVRRWIWPRSILFLVAFGAWFVPTGLAFGSPAPGPCSANAESRQFDYWLGDWTITSPGGSGRATSKVSLDLDKCLVVESWDGGKGHSGKNMFAYSPDDKSWHGMFADNQGHVHVFVDGRVVSGSAEFNGPSRGPRGEAVLNRVSVVRLAPNKVEQTWEKSTDNGGSWTTVFRGQYSRQNP
jgi:hypothetical protein